MHLKYDQAEESSGAVEITWKDAYAPTVLPEGYALETAKELGHGRIGNSSALHYKERVVTLFIATAVVRWVSSRILHILRYD